MEKKTKYPRTPHLPNSPGASNDDRILKDTTHFDNKEVVVSLKFDGENTTLTRDYLHARSLNDKPHWSKTWIKNFHGTISHTIPEGMRIIVENLYAAHSIEYNDLLSYAYGLSVWEGQKCLSWPESENWFKIFGITPVMPFYWGIWDADIIHQIFSSGDLIKNHEGYVVRLAGEFEHGDFVKSVAKWVRANHVGNNDEHWFHRTSGKTNKLKNQQ